MSLISLMTGGCMGESNHGISEGRDERDCASSSYKGSPLVSSTTSSTPSTPIPMSPEANSNDYQHPRTGTPSPILLNPISETDWDSKKATSPSTLNDRVQKLEKGYQLRLHEEDGQYNIIHLSLHKDHSSITVKSGKNNRENQDESIETSPEHCHRLKMKSIESISPADGCPQISKLNNDSNNRTDSSTKFFSIVISDDSDDPSTRSIFMLEARSKEERNDIMAALISLWELSLLTIDLNGSEECNLRKTETTMSLMKRTRIHDDEDSCTIRRNSVGRKTPINEGLEISLQLSKDMNLMTDTKAFHRRLVSCPDLSKERSNLPKRSITLPSLDGKQSTKHLQQRESSVSDENNHFKLQVGREWCPNDTLSLAMEHVATSWTQMLEGSSSSSSSSDNVNCLRNCVDNNANSNVSDNVAERRLENQIADYLGSPPDFNSCLMATEHKHSWDDENDDGIINRQQMRNRKKKNSKKNQRSLRNRSSVFNGQAYHMRRLRQDMVFSDALDRSTAKMGYLQTIVSYDDACASADTKNRLKTGGQFPVDSPSSTTSTSSSPAQTDFFQQFVAKISGVNNSIDTNSNEAVMYYDSDPEDLRPTNLYRRRPRRVLADRQNINNDNNTNIKNNMDKTPPSKRDTTALSKQYNDNNLFGGNVMNDTHFADVIEEMKSETITLMWHPSQTKINRNQRPRCVKVWIERGTVLCDYSSMQPKLMWRSLYERKLHEKKLNIAHFGQPDCINLLDVSRILPVHATTTSNKNKKGGAIVDRNTYPFVNKNKCLVIETRNNQYLFEAQTTEERDRIVFGLKLVVARLAALLIMKDIKVMDEFFAPASSRVPGEAPL